MRFAVATMVAMKRPREGWRRWWGSEGEGKKGGREAREEEER